MEKKLFNNQKLLIKVVFYFNMFASKMKSGSLKIKFKNHLLVLFIPVALFSQIEKQVRDQNPGLFKNQKLYHSIPNPFFKSRSHNLDFITDIPQDSVLAATLFFKTNLMEYPMQSHKLQFLKLAKNLIISLAHNQKIFDILAYSDQALFTFNRFSRKAELRLTTKHIKK